MRRFLWDLICFHWNALRHPTWEHEDTPDLDADTAARTAWVREHRHPDGGESA